MFSLPFLLAPIALAILYPSFQPRDAPNRLSLSEELSKTPRVLFVTAHPDDEAMFFSPTLLALTGAGSTGKQLADVYALTLSRGNYEGLGRTRQQELEASYTKLGVPKSKLFTIDHPKLPDNSSVFWEEQDVGEAINSVLISLNNTVDSIITFDKKGISGHSNHISVFTGAKAYLSSQASPRPKLYTLISASLPMKYTSIIAPFLAKADVYVVKSLIGLNDYVADRIIEALEMDAVPAASLHDFPIIFVSGYKDWWNGVVAMWAHQSQLVWFRYLWLAFSRYQWVNELAEVRL